MIGQLFIATHNGVVEARRDGDRWVEAHKGLLYKNVTCITAREGVALAGTTEGIFRYDSERAASRKDPWTPASDGLTIRHIRWLAYYPGVSDLEFAGTEPAGIFVSYDGALSWRMCPEVARYRDKYRWSLPYSPQAGCVRGFAFHGERAYAAVEDGGVLVSDDGGETWQVAQGSRGPADHDPPASYIHSDVHSFEVHPSSPDLVFAPTGGGFYRSGDGGESWDYLYDCYCRAAWVDPNDPAHIVLGPADGVDQNGRIEETIDGGKTWTPASTGLSVPWNNTMVERFIQVDDALLAVLSNGELIAAPLEGLAWRQILPDVRGVSAVAPMVE
ncbi:MAG: exo-alpha-sialidase [Chloroflexota bacterium]|nr:MAG: exo-alpha-sialidase [Chloroflexota bacterium]